MALGHNVHSKLHLYFQLVISDVHFRYEDKATADALPFAFGITMAKLSAQSTTEDWVSL